MAKKQWWESVPKWLWLTSIPAVIGTVVLIAKTISVWAEIPNDVKQLKDYVAVQQQSNLIQQEANSLMQQMIQNEKEARVSPDGKYLWDDETKKWIPIKKGK